MLNTLGVVEVRREKGLDWRISRKLGGTSIIEQVVRRATDCQRIDAVVVVLTGEGPDDPIRRLVPSDVTVFSKPQCDPLASIAAALDELPAKGVIHISADTPFIDPMLTDRLVSTAVRHPECDYIGYCRADGRPAILTHLGLSAEWCRASSLQQAHREAKSVHDRQNSTAYLFGHPKKFKVRMLPLPAVLDREDLRLRIDREEDWEHAQDIYEALGHDEWDWQGIADLLHSQPALRGRMAVLNREKQVA